MHDPTPIQSRRFTLDGEFVEDLPSFCASFDEATQLAIGDLELSEELVLGGGAFATFTLKRTA